jgi:hypothetical protein
MTFAKMTSARAVLFGCASSAAIHAATIVVVSRATTPPPIAVLVSHELEVAITVTLESSPSPEVVDGDRPSRRGPEQSSPSAAKARRPLHPVLAVTAPISPPEPAVLPVIAERVDASPSPSASEARPQPVGTATVSPEVARALRVYDSFPTITGDPAARHQQVALEVCVSERGLVSRATVGASAMNAFQERVRAAVLTWRYRPLLLDGRPTPFCHLLRVIYERS